MEFWYSIAILKKGNDEKINIINNSGYSPNNGMSKLGLKPIV